MTLPLSPEALSPEVYTTSTLDTWKGFSRIKVSVWNHLLRFQKVTDKMEVRKGPLLEETSVPSVGPGSPGRYTPAQGCDVLSCTATICSLQIDNWDVPKLTGGWGRGVGYQRERMTVVTLNWIWFPSEMWVVPMLRMREKGMLQSPNLWRPLQTEIAPMRKSITFPSQRHYGEGMTVPLWGTSDLGSVQVEIVTESSYVYPPSICPLFALWWLVLY